MPPRAHGLLGAHDAPAVQAAHTPAVVQTPDAPPAVQAVPTGRKPLSLQTGVPLEQSTAALVAHGLLEAHDAPAAQAVHTPDALHTPVTAPSVQAVPAALNVPSVHTGPPVEQSTAAVAAQGLVEEQVLPAVQAVQAPEALQTPATPPVVQAVPTSLVPCSRQTGEPEEQSVMPLAAHGFAGEQAAPGLHALQVPLAPHTPLIAPEVQAVPAGSNV